MITIVDLSKTRKQPTKSGKFTSDEAYDAVDSGLLKEGDIIQLENGDGHAKNVVVKFVDLVE